MALGQQEKTIYRLLIKGRARVHITTLHHVVLLILSAGVPQRQLSSFLGSKAASAELEKGPMHCVLSSATGQPATPMQVSPPTETWTLYLSKRAS